MNGPLSHDRGDIISVLKHTNEESFVQLPSDSFPTMKKKEIGSKASEQQYVRSTMPEQGSTLYI